MTNDERKRLELLGGRVALGRQALAAVQDLLDAPALLQQEVRLHSENLSGLLAVLALHFDLAVAEIDALQSIPIPPSDRPRDQNVVPLH